MGISLLVGDRGSAIIAANRVDVKEPLINSLIVMRQISSCVRDKIEPIRHFSG
jgi:hypothetical protein